MAEKYGIQSVCAKFCETVKSFYDKKNVAKGDKFFMQLMHEMADDNVNDDDDDDEEEEEYKLFKDEVTTNSLYPVKPFYRWLATKLFHWIYNDIHPSCSHSRLENLNEIESDFNTSIKYRVEKLQEFIKVCEATFTADNVCDGVEKCFCDNTMDSYTRITCLKNLNTTRLAVHMDLTNDLLAHLTKGDILKLLGFRKTVGSLEQLPPDLVNLWTSYQALHNINARITVGARALAKHCHRSKDKWWGESTGNEHAKNRHALIILQRIFRNIVWLNIHVLPHEMHVLEIRCKEGYGLRWSHDGKFFRGFLEPQMLDGHKNGWVH
ncbi:uncharacterized protein LOC130623249 [Hydractinia symbiolongicarpus]|uniref:uncharacterized protein LOC130623249 n=1 Tax=Hydractinia symbiolongicarpus TaxID=13093 RepID=UPI00254BF937|nr:uncharacterized protein LOC130623249 [Hydractinia symbiolongicarpus]